MTCGCPASAEGRLRTIALALPGAEERETWGKPAFRVAGRLFLTLGSDGSSATMKASLDDQAVLVAEDPSVFSAAAYLGRYSWVTVSIDRGDPDELAALVVEAWRQRAPRGLAERRGGTVGNSQGVHVVPERRGIGRGADPSGTRTRVVQHLAQRKHLR